MPYPNEHACRIRQPGEFEKGSFRRIARGGRSLIIGRLKGKTTTTTQAIRYPKDRFTAEQARENCKKHGGSFEAAASAQAFSYEEACRFYSDPLNNPLMEEEG